MQANDDIFSLLQEKGAQVARETLRAIILQPGAIGDCVLTLPLAAFMKRTLDLGGVDILGHTDYLGLLPGRTCVDGIRSIDSTDLHRLFTEPADFDLADRDSLIGTFADYAWIVTFLGEPGSNFEQNLIFTANCSHSAEVITLSMKPPEGFNRHIAEFYTQQLIDQSGFSIEPSQVPQSDILIRTGDADRKKGAELLQETGCDLSGNLLVIHPGSGGLKKCCYLDNFLIVARQAQLKGWDTVFLLGPAELDRYSHGRIEDINSVGACLTDLSLSHVVALLSCADAFIGNDSGITHLAAALGVRTFAVFGPTDPAVYAPLGPAVTVLRSKTAAFSERPSVTFQRKLLAALTTPV
ncbi:MAG: glycosyltransferase family 9 protein [Phycisphaerales bacterium]|nr:MAG: glycosyltransferase family 9 protein [Phycisphaerales bacterium]